VATGQYYIFAKADGDDAIAETQETNNTTPRAIQIGGDLIISALTVPARGANGGTITVTDTTTNQGAGPIGASTVRFFLSANSVLDGLDTPLNPGRAVPALGPGLSHAGQTTLTLPSGLVPGNYYIIAKADGDDAVVETQEANNTNGRSIAVGPDLTVSSMTLPSSVHAGASFTINDVVSNPGLDAAASSTLKIYLSTNTVVDFGDPLLASRSVPSIAGGGTNTGSTSATIAAGTAPGTYYVIAQVDTDNVVIETSELNNTLVRILTVQP
jgi:subtilase family serine protease